MRTPLFVAIVTIAIGIGNSIAEGIWGNPIFSDMESYAIVAIVILFGLMIVLEDISEKL